VGPGEDGLPERAVVASPIESARKKGTREAVAEALEALDATVVLTEWWEMDPPGESHTFIHVAGRHTASDANSVREIGLYTSSGILLAIHARAFQSSQMALPPSGSSSAISSSPASPQITSASATSSSKFHGHRNRERFGRASDPGGNHRGQPSVFEADGINSVNDAAAGGNPADVFWSGPGTHTHFDWFFTQPGRYRVGLRAVGWKEDGVGGLCREESPVTHFHFDVESVTAPTDRLGEAPPQANDDAFNVALDTTDIILNVLSNNHSSPDSLEELGLPSVTPPVHGSVSISPGNQTITYRPDPSHPLPESFTYTIRDEHGGTASTNVTITWPPRMIRTEMTSSST
jgi:surface-anchored protein